MSEMQELLTRALALCGPDEAKAPTTVLHKLVPPGVELYASKAHRPVRWWYYLTMPRGWTPPEEGGRWMQNPSSGLFWDTGSGATENEALANGLRRLLGAVVVVKETVDA